MGALAPPCVSHTGMPCISHTLGELSVPWCGDYPSWRLLLSLPAYLLCVLGPSSGSGCVAAARLGLHHLMVVPSCLPCSPGSAVVEWGNRT